MTGGQTCRGRTMPGAARTSCRCHCAAKPTSSPTWSNCSPSSAAIPSERPAPREPRHHAPQFLQRATTRAPQAKATTSLTERLALETGERAACPIRAAAELRRERSFGRKAGLSRMAAVGATRTFVETATSAKFLIRTFTCTLLNCWYPSKRALNRDLNIRYIT